MAPSRPRFVLRLFLPAALLVGAACASGPTGRRPQPPSAETVQRELGMRDVIQAGQEYARNNAIVLAATNEAVEIRPNIWRIRFGLAEEPGRLLELEFDELARRVTRAQEIEIIPGEFPAGGEQESDRGVGPGRAPLP